MRNEETEQGHAELIPFCVGNSLESTFGIKQQRSDYR